MSDPGSDSSSASSASVSSRAASPQPQAETTPNEDTIDEEKKGAGDENESDAAPEPDPDADNEDLEANSTEHSVEDPDAESVHVASGIAFRDDDALPEGILSVDFVVIHGIYDRWDGEGGNGSGSSTWVRECIKDLNSCSRALTYEYDANQVFSGSRSRESIHRIALKLLRGLTARRRNETRKRIICFHSNDIGGIIVKDALATAALEGSSSSWKEIAEMTRVLVFAGCPHRAFTNLEMEDKLSYFLFTSVTGGIPSNVQRPSAPSIRGLAKAVIEINGIFVESKIPLRNRIISVYSTDPNSDKNMSRVLDSHTAILGIPLEKRIPVPDDSDYVAVTKYLNTLEHDLAPTVEEAQFRFERKILSLASPVFPFHTDAQQGGGIPFTQEYSAWFDHQGPQLLYMHGNRVREAAEQVFIALDDVADKETKPTIVLYFSFDRWDVRCDSIRDMLSTFLAQIINHYPRLGEWIEILSTQLQHERGWTELDLVQLFERFRLSDEIEHVICVLNHFDECTKGSRTAFLESFAYAAQISEITWKVVVTSHKPGALTEELSGALAPFCVTIDLTASGLMPDTKADIEDELSRMTKSRPELTLQSEEVREELHSIANLDLLARHIICEQVILIDEWPDKSSTREILATLDLAQSEAKEDEARNDETLEKVLDWVLRKVPDQDTLRRALSWLLYSVRPLTIWELATVLCFESDQDRDGIVPRLSVVESVISKILGWLAGIVEVVQNEVRFRHPRLHNIMVEGSMAERPPSRPKYLWEEVKETAHSEITDLCLKYLSRASVRELIDKTFQVTDSKTFETPTFADRSNLASYAIQAWTHHYSLSSSRPDLSRVLSESVSGNLAEALARGHWALANTVTKSTTPSETLFPIFAGLGLLDVLKPQDQANAFRGLLEAASKGQAKTIRLLLKDFNFSESQLVEALAAVCSSGDEDVALELLDYIASKSEDTKAISWPPVLLYRAGWLGLDRFADKILTLGCSPDPETEVKAVLSASPLFQAARNCHAKTVQVLLKHNADTTFCGAYGRNTLHLVAAQGHAKIIKILVEEGNFDVEAHEGDGFTALYLASVWGQYKAVEQLLSLGADPNMSIPDTEENWAPLIVAADEGFKRCVQLLLDNKARIDIRGFDGTPLRYAAVGGHLEVCNILLAKGANPSSKLINPPLLIQIVVNSFSNPKANILDVLDRFLELDLDLNVKDEYEIPLLILAYRHEKKDFIVRRLLDHGADVNITNSKGQSTLLLAAMDLNTSIVSLLLERDDIKVNELDEANLAPLYFAAADSPSLQLLLEKGAKPDLGNNNGFTTLMYAAWFKYTDSVKLLLEHGASTELEYTGDAEHLVGWTALMCTTGHGDDETFRLIAEAEADMKHKSKQGLPVLHQAATGDRLPTMLEFPSRIDVNQTNEYDATALHVQDVSLENFKRLVNAGANIEAKNGVGNTPLAEAAKLRTPDCLDRVKYLLKKGANVNSLSPGEGTPLHLACRSQNMELVKLLVEHGADVTQTCDGIAGTPLIAACLPSNYAYDPEPEPLIRYLLDIEEDKPHARPKERRADVTVKSGLLGYPINAAALQGSSGAINLIMEQEGAKIDVRDDVGRMPIHFAALNGIRSFDAILGKGGDINAADKMGRTALHWAALACMAQVVEKILSLLTDKTALDVPDIDGWTPLCWAARGPSTSLSPIFATEYCDQAQTLKLLLENGANRIVVAKVNDEKWTPLKIARFSYTEGCDEAIELLKHGLVSDEEKEKEKEAKENTGDDEAEGSNSNKDGGNDSDEPDEFKSKKGNLRRSSCDGCEAIIRGLAYHCLTCADTNYCWKCHPHVALFHPTSHDFEQQGPWFKEEDSEADKEDLHSATSSSSSSDASDTESEASDS
ncbi:ankyrin repeat-containing domain protein [Thelonectria olida]|uniref:Ankyrin repeat-containing domain protein n=1 Tax=Thelonectria olida TaxID=1576542 RepID=A0A9P8VVT4_9HYPO|nr:ankyrin repeat-containing domain protein [Thelonectria olida]